MVVLLQAIAQMPCAPQLVLGVQTVPGGQSALVVQCVAVLHRVLHTQTPASPAS